VKTSLLMNGRLWERFQRYRPGGAFYFHFRENLAPDYPSLGEFLGSELGALREGAQFLPSHIRVNLRELDESIETAVRTGDYPVTANDFS